MFGILSSACTKQQSGNFSVEQQSLSHSLKFMFAVVGFVWFFVLIFFFGDRHHAWLVFVF
jgi:hypothetical protein